MIASSRLFTALLCCLPLAAADEFNSHAVTTQMVAMRDGVRIATDIYRPARGGQAVEGKFPSLLYRTPYNKANGRYDAAWFAKQGYTVVVQDCRGRFASEGEFYPFVNEGTDGFDSIEWTAAQPWSDGKVGTIGSSYLAWDQYHAAMYHPPHLVAMFAIVGGAVFYDEYAHPGGTPNLGWPMWILGSARSSPAAMRDAAAAARLDEVLKNPAAWLRLPPAARAEALSSYPAHRKIYDDLYAHPVFDSYWKHKSLDIAGNYKAMKDVPTFFLSGWYDYFGEGTLRNFTALSKSQRTEKKLMMGPWPHSTGARRCGDADFGAAAGVSVREVARDWFDHWMKGRPYAAIPAEPVRIFRMGGGSGARTAQGAFEHGGEWTTVSAWPPVGTVSRKYHVRAGGLLSPASPGREAPSSFDYNPEKPVPTIGGRYDHAGSPACAQDNSALNGRGDVLAFATEPLGQALEVTGPVRATVWVSSDAADADFTAKLIDVYPNGYALILADGQVRMQYRERTRRSPLKPGRAYKATIELGSTSNLFAKGHRIRLDISSSNYPKFEPNPLKARNTVYHDAARPSFVELPVR